MAHRLDPYTQLMISLGLDPRAVKSVSRVEQGVPGAVGDGGHAFGPFQLNDAGGVLTGRPGNHKAFAESNAGIRWALQKIASVAGGLKGQAAVNAIVRRFERPADPNTEVARALALYGGGDTARTDTPASSSGNALAVSRKNNSLSLLRGLLNDEGIPALVNRLQNAPGSAVSPSKPFAPTGGTPTPGNALGVPAELFYDPLGGYKLGNSIGAIGGHKDHVHVAFTNEQQLLKALALAQNLGLHVSENPYVDPVAPVHAKNSYHYRTFPGKVKGRSVGEAFDASGSSNAMASLFKMLAP